MPVVAECKVQKTSEPKEEPGGAKLPAGRPAPLLTASWPDLWVLLSIQADGKLLR